MLIPFFIQLMNEHLQNVKSIPIPTPTSEKGISDQASTAIRFWPSLPMGRPWLQAVIRSYTFVNGPLTVSVPSLTMLYIVQTMLG